MIKINEEYFKNKLFCRSKVYWEVQEVSSLINDGDDYYATLECKQKFLSELDLIEHLRESIICELLAELDGRETIQLEDGVYLNIVKEYLYEDHFLNKRFLVNISPEAKYISESYYLNEVFRNRHREQIIKR